METLKLLRKIFRMINNVWTGGEEGAGTTPQPPRKEAGQTLNEASGKRQHQQGTSTDLMVRRTRLLLQDNPDRPMNFTSL